jgi:hypothetical protein
MNGRIYDPVLGRFLSADPFVGDVGDSQDYNRYSYVGNNPMNATDPSGYFSLKDAVKIVAIVVVAYFTAGAALYALGGGVTGLAAGATATFGQSLAAIAGANGLGLTMGGAIAAGAGAGFASGFAGSLLNGGSIGDAFKAGVIGGVVGGIAGGLTYGIGSLYQDAKIGFFDRMLAHGAVQGGVAEAQGGQFRHGFYAGFLTAGASPFVGDGIVGAIESAAIGGTASAIGGGKFVNGAVSSAFQYLLNGAQHKGKAGGGSRYAGKQIRGADEGAGVLDRVVFDGSALTGFDADGKVVGAWEARSGREGSQSPENQRDAAVGPIPEGRYTVNQSDYQQRPISSQFAGVFGRGTWPGNYKSWGNYRIWLRPMEGTNTFGRTGFSLHGGDFLGSAGCVDLARGMESFAPVFRSSGRDITLTVKY